MRSPILDLSVDNQRRVMRRSGSNGCHKLSALVLAQSQSGNVVTFWTWWDTQGAIETAGDVVVDEGSLGTGGTCICAFEAELARAALDERDVSGYRSGIVGLLSHQSYAHKYKLCPKIRDELTNSHP